MSLFSHDEICKGCKHSMFAKNSYEAPIFWACKIGEETHVNGITGDCPAKEIEEEPKFMNDIEKEMNKIIKRTFFQGSQIDQETAASACYEIHRREVESNYIPKEEHENEVESLKNVIQFDKEGYNHLDYIFQERCNEIQKLKEENERLKLFIPELLKKQREICAEKLTEYNDMDWYADLVLNAGEPSIDLNKE